MCAQGKEGPTQSECVNCQVLGMQKVIDMMLKCGHFEIAIMTAIEMNMVITSPQFQNATHLLAIERVKSPLGRDYSCNLVPRKDFSRTYSPTGA